MQESECDLLEFAYTNSTSSSLFFECVENPATIRCVTHLHSGALTDSHCPLYSSNSLSSNNHRLPRKRAPRTNRELFDGIDLRNKAIQGMLKMMLNASKFLNAYSSKMFDHPPKKNDWIEYYSKGKRNDFEVPNCPPPSHSQMEPADRNKSPFAYPPWN